MTLKFETVAEVGDTIRAYDFQPMEGRRDVYVEGVVVEKGMVHGIAAFTVQVTEDTGFPSDPREEVIVPMQVAFMEYDTRVQKVA